MKPYEPKWPHGYCTRDGKPVRVLCTDAIGRNGPIFGLVMLTEGLEVSGRWYSNGLVWSSGEKSDADLMCVEPEPFEPTEAEMFRFLVSNGGGGVVENSSADPYMKFRFRRRYLEQNYYGETPEAAIREAMLAEKEAKK